MGCVSSEVNVTKVTSSAPKGRFANFKRWIGRKCRAFFNSSSVRTTDVEPFNAPESACPSPTSSCSTNLSDYMEEPERQERHLDNARCATCVIRFNGLFPVDQLDNSDNERSVVWRSAAHPSGTATPINPRRLPRFTCRHHHDNIQLLRDIMALEGRAISQDEAEDLLDNLKSDIEESKEGMKMEQRKREEEEKGGEEMELNGILEIETIQTPAPAPTPSGRKSRYQKMKEKCCKILHRDDDDDEGPEDEVETENNEEIIEIDEAAETSEEVIEQGHELKYANSTEELEATINAIFKRWNLSMPDDQGGLAKINETVRSSLSRAGSARPTTSGIRPVTPFIQPVTTYMEAGTSKPSMSKLTRPKGARLPRTTSTGKEGKMPWSLLV